MFNFQIIKIIQLNDHLRGFNNISRMCIKALEVTDTSIESDWIKYDDNRNESAFEVKLLAMIMSLPPWNKEWSLYISWGYFFLLSAFTSRYPRSIEFQSSGKDRWDAMNLVARGFTIRSWAVFFLKAPSELHSLTG